MEPILGSIAYFALSWTPKPYLPCDGRLLPIAQNSALFSLLGTQYGGDGIQTFGLPNLPPLELRTGGSIYRYIAVYGVYPSRA